MENIKEKKNVDPYLVSCECRRGEIKEEVHMVGRDLKMWMDLRLPLVRNLSTIIIQISSLDFIIRLGSLEILL